MKFMVRILSQPLTSRGLVIGELAPLSIVSIGGIVLTNQRTPIRNASPNPEREPQFGYANPHSDVRGCALSLPHL